MYDPITGQQKLWEWDAASRTWGAFIQDTWKARRNLTVTLGLRFDDQGNPWSRADTTVFGNFYLGEGSTFEERVANGRTEPTEKALRRSPKVWNPRAGFAWDVTGEGRWVVRGGAGIYSNWLTAANVQEEFRGNPPGLITPTFFEGTSTPPIFVQGTTDTPPFGFQFPPLAGSPLCPTAPCLDEKGGIRGAQFSIGGINPELKSPTAYIVSAAVERQLGRSPVGQHHLQRLSLREPGGQRQSGRGRQLRRQHQRTTGRPSGQAAGISSHAAQFQLRPDSLCRQRSRGQLQRRDVRSERTRKGAVLRRFVHALELERRCGQLSHGDKPAPVLRAVSVGRPAPPVAHGQLHVPRVHDRRRS